MGGPSLIAGERQWNAERAWPAQAALLYIIFTYFCLRRLCNRRGGMAPEKQKKSDCDAEPGTPGVYSPARWEEKPLMGNGRSKSGLSSDAGSDHTDQSLLSE